MPELPEVESLVRSLRSQLVGRPILRLEERFAGVLSICPEASRELEGTRVRGVRRRGKLLLIELEDERRLSVHLRMTGSLAIEAAETTPRAHTHVVIGLDRGEELRFSDPRRFGRVELHTAASLAATPFMKSLGPEPLDVDPLVIARRLAKKRAPIKAVLLDQRVLAGIGNIYADEILHDCGLHPRLEAGTLRGREVVELHESVGRILRSAIESGGSTIRDYRSLAGEPGGYQLRHRVFGRTGQPCLRCGATIRRILLSGRGTHFCGRCQPMRRRRTATRLDAVVRAMGECEE